MEKIEFLHDYVIDEDLGDYKSLKKLDKRITELRRKHGLSDKARGESDPK